MPKGIPLTAEEKMVRHLRNQIDQLELVVNAQAAEKRMLEANLKRISALVHAPAPAQ